MKLRFVDEAIANGDAIRFLVMNLAEADDRLAMTRELVDEYKRHFSGEETGEFGRLLRDIRDVGVCDVGCALNTELALQGQKEEAHEFLLDWVIPYYPDSVCKHMFYTSPHVLYHEVGGYGSFGGVTIIMSGDEIDDNHITDYELTQVSEGPGITVTGITRGEKHVIRNGAFLSTTKVYPNGCRCTPLERATFDRKREARFVVLPICDYRNSIDDSDDGPQQPLYLDGLSFRRALKIGEAASRGDVDEIRQALSFYNKLLE